jgi:hypothetical protein
MRGSLPEVGTIYKLRGSLPSAFHEKITVFPSGESFSESGRIPAIEGSRIMSRTERFCGKAERQKTKVKKQKTAAWKSLFCGIL